MNEKISFKTRWCSIMSGNTIINFSDYLLDVFSPIRKEKINEPSR